MKKTHELELIKTIHRQPFELSTGEIFFPIKLIYALKGDKKGKALRLIINSGSKDEVYSFKKITLTMVSAKKEQKKEVKKCLNTF